MDKNRVARELLKLAKALENSDALQTEDINTLRTGSNEDEYNENRKLWNKLDRELEKFQNFIRGSSLHSIRKKKTLKAISALITEYVDCDSAFYNMTEEGEAMSRAYSSKQNS